MKAITKWKIIIDILMTVLLLLSMSYLLVGEEMHEWIGSGLFLLFIVHHILNRKWFSTIFKGKYTALRFLQNAINLMMLFSIIGLMVSGIILSRYVFDFLQISKGTAFARTLHLLCSYWGFVFMSLHLGFHWAMIMEMVKKSAGSNLLPAAIKWGLRLLAAITAVYGGYAFIKHDLVSYMSLRVQFVFFDPEQSLFQFFVDYTAMMVLWAWLAYYTKSLLMKVCRKQKEA